MKKLYILDYALVADQSRACEVMYLASEVDALIATIPPYLLDPDDSHYCEPLAKALEKARDEVADLQGSD